VQEKSAAGAKHAPDFLKAGLRLGEMFDHVAVTRSKQPLGNGSLVGGGGSDLADGAVGADGVGVGIDTPDASGPADESEFMFQAPVGQNVLAAPDIEPVGVGNDEFG